MLKGDLKSDFLYIFNLPDCIFGKNKPASTTIQVERLVHPDWNIEIEATAVID